MLEVPYANATFDAATAFFFLMYLVPEDRETVLREAYRVTRPGVEFHIWDVTIPDCKKSKRKFFVVPLEITLPKKTIKAAYGTVWKGSTMYCNEILSLAQRIGFSLI